jgi:hypothetical protein
MTCLGSMHFHFHFATSTGKMRILPAWSLRALYSTEGFPTQAMICVNGELTKLREYQYRPVLPIFDVYGFGDGVDIRSELLSSTSGFES